MFIRGVHDQRKTRLSTVNFFLPIRIVWLTIAVQKQFLGLLKHRKQPLNTALRAPNLGHRAGEVTFGINLHGFTIIGVNLNCKRLVAALNRCFIVNFRFVFPK